MKVGIITFHRAVNYGAILQTYALQKILNNLLVQNEVIDYRYNKIETDYVPLNFKKIKSFKDLIGITLHYKARKNKRKKFDSFIDKYICLSEKSYTKEMLPGIEENYDVFITGSDQVWGITCTDFDTAYFFDFVKNNSKKNSYAASFGFDKIPKEYVDKYEKLLSQFNRISVRENNGIKIIKDLLGRDISVELDPTLLLNRQQWLEVAKKPKQKKYVLMYIMQKNNSIIKFAENLAKEKKCELIFLDDAFIHKVNATYVSGVAPEEWVGYFLYADYIVTNSFHGVAFSINLNKEFFVELQVPPATGNARLENLMDTFDLRSRQIINSKNSNSTINYNKVNQILDRYRGKSIDYLKSIVSENNE